MGCTIWELFTIPTVAGAEIVVMKKRNGISIVIENEGELSLPKSLTMKKHGILEKSMLARMELKSQRHPIIYSIETYVDGCMLY